MKFRIVLCVLIVGVCLLSLAKGMEARNDEKRVAIIYGSRYGSTAQTAEWIAEGMQGVPKVMSAKDVGDLSYYDLIILGSGIYSGQLQEDMLAFLAERKDEVKNKIVALFVVCGASGPSAERYLEMFAAECGGITPILKRDFRGWLKKELLSPEDYQLMENLYKRRNQPFENYDNTDKTKCVEFGKEIWEAIKDAPQ
ncbi:hypothetical protein CEE39_05630 [bacterium (candidate division B38) B3_B38]|nr:MAG: hypothetical protein CEE39_05630 [bacterium (candidate division B38) B3_B38]